MKIAGGNVLIRKQLEKFTNALMHFAMKLQENLMPKQAELINDNKEFLGKLNVIEAKFDTLIKENETL